MIKSAIFDVDGTLLDSMKIWDDAGERYLSSVGKTAENGLSEKLCDMSLTEGAEYMKKQYALSFSTDEIVSGVLKIIEDFYFYEVGLKNDAKEILQFLESNNIKMIIATSSDKTHIKRAFDFLRPGGSLVAVCSSSIQWKSTRKYEQFRDWLSEHTHSIDECGAKFEMTGVHTVVLVVDKAA